MDNRIFWQTIDEARTQAGNWEEMVEPLVDSLEQLDVSEILLWQQIFNEYQTLSYKSKLWAAAYIINGGCSDDGFDYFRAWLTAQGKNVFMASLNDPEALAYLDSIESGCVEFEDIMGVACDSYFKKLCIDPDYDRFNNDMDKHPISDAQRAVISAEIKYAPDIDNEWDVDGLKQWLPILCETCRW